MWLCVWLAISLAGCSPALGEPGAVAPPVTEPPTPTRTLPPPSTIPATPSPESRARVSIWTAWDPVELTALRSIIDLFQVEHPEIAFSVAYYPPAQLLETFLACPKPADCPTILIGPAEWGPILAGEARILDVSSYIDPQLQRDLYPVAWDQVVYEEIMTGLPLELQGMVLYRNSELMPKPSVQLAGLIEEARALRQRTQIAGVFDLGFENAIPFLSACGGALFTAGGDLTIPSPEGACWLEMLKSMGAAGRVVFSDEEDRRSFEDGESAWLVESSVLRVELGEALGAGALSVDPWPTYEETGLPLKGFVWSENLYFSAGVEQVQLDASWTFARYLFGEDAQALLSVVSGPAHIPAQASIVLEDGLMQAISDMLRSGVARPLRLDLARYALPIEGAIDDVVLQGIDPLQALSVAADLLNRTTSTPQPQP